MRDNLRYSATATVHCWLTNIPCSRSRSNSTRCFIKKMNCAIYIYWYIYIYIYICVCVCASLHMGVSYNEGQPHIEGWGSPLLCHCWLAKIPKTKSTNFSQGSKNELRHQWPLNPLQIQLFWIQTWLVPSMSIKVGIGKHIYKQNFVLSSSSSSFLTCAMANAFRNRLLSSSSSPCLTCAIYVVWNCL